MFYGLKDGRYAVYVSNGETIIRDISDCNIVEKTSADIIQKNLNTLSEQLSVLSGSAPISALDMPVMALPTVSD